MNVYYLVRIMMSVTQNEVCNCEIKSILTYSHTYLGFSGLLSEYLGQLPVDWWMFTAAWRRKMVSISILPHYPQNVLLITILQSEQGFLSCLLLVTVARIESTTDFSDQCFMYFSHVFSFA